VLALEPLLERVGGLPKQPLNTSVAVSEALRAAKNRRRLAIGEKAQQRREGWEEERNKVGGLMRTPKPKRLDFQHNASPTN
jgi:hypothetical protein